MFLFLTNDLMMQSQAVAAAKKSETKLVAVPSFDSLQKNLDQSSSNVLAIIVDLQFPAFNFETFDRVCSQTSDAMQKIAFAQHVEEDLLLRAKQSQFHSVLTRGSFSRQLPEILANLLGPENGRTSF